MTAGGPLPVVTCAAAAGVSFDGGTLTEPLRDPYRRASRQSLDEGQCVQGLHVGRNDAQQPTIERLHRYVGDHGLAVAGRHHEIYISDPRRTGPEKLKTVIRVAVQPARRRGSRRAAD